MANFDPAAATQAYLSILTPDQHAKAVAYTQGGHWLLLWSALVSIIASVLVLRSGVLPRLRNWIEAGRPKPVRVILLIVLVDAIIESVMALPWDNQPGVR